GRHSTGGTACPRHGETSVRLRTAPQRAAHTRIQSAAHWPALFVSRNVRFFDACFLFSYLYAHILLRYPSFALVYFHTLNLHFSDSVNHLSSSSFAPAASGRPGSLSLSFYLPANTSVTWYGLLLMSSFLC